MKVSDLQKGYYIFGNKGSVWANKAHISGTSSTTLCGVPKLSTNWARIEELKECGCKKCCEIYLKQINDGNLSDLRK